jgi:hypothetical protein
MNHIVVRYSEDSHSQTAKMIGAILVIGLASFVAFSIEFNNEICRRTIEINNIGFDRMLATEF